MTSKRIDVFGDKVSSCGHKRCHVNGQKRLVMLPVAASFSSEHIRWLLFHPLHKMRENVEEQGNIYVSARLLRIRWESGGFKNKGKG